MWILEISAVKTLIQIGSLYNEHSLRLTTLTEIITTYPTPCETRLGTSASSFVVVDVAGSSVRPNDWPKASSPTKSNAKW
jgi:hypothetical protein